MEGEEEVEEGDRKEEVEDEEVEGEEGVDGEGEEVLGGGRRGGERGRGTGGRERRAGGIGGKRSLDCVVRVRLDGGIERGGRKWAVMMMLKLKCLWK